MKAHEAKMKSEHNDPQKLTNLLNACYILIFDASENGLYETTVNLGNYSDNIVEKVRSTLEGVGYKVSVFRSQVSNNMWISWKDAKNVENI